MKCMSTVIPYLGVKIKKNTQMKFLVQYDEIDQKYQDLLFKCREYTDSMQENNKMSDTGSPEESAKSHLQVKNNSVMDKDPEEVEKENKATIKKSLQHLDNPIALDLIRKIIKFLEFLCRQSIQNNDNDTYDQISDVLNECAREEALFNCLMIPNDTISLEVVKCFFFVPMSDLDLDEIE